MTGGREGRSAADTGVALTVSRLTKRFGERTAFEDVSFEVARGEVFGFLGPNGAGKTTMVRTLGTLITPTAGSATVAGIPLSPARGGEIRERISIMPGTRASTCASPSARTWSSSPASTACARPGPASARRWRRSTWRRAAATSAAGSPRGSASASGWRARSSATRR